jgi:hypothetical protein
MEMFRMQRTLWEAYDIVELYILLRRSCNRVYLLVAGSYVATQS